MDLLNAKLITHGNCPDGTTAAILFIISGGQRKNIIFSDPNKNKTSEILEDLNASHDGPILLVDMSVSEAVAETIYRNDVVLLDHHIAAICLKKFNWCNIDENNENCGCKLFYNWLINNRFYSYNSKLLNYKNLVNIVDDIDRWKWMIPESNDINSLFNVLGADLFFERFLKNFNIELDIFERYAVDIQKEKLEKYKFYKNENVRIFIKEINGEMCKIGFVECESYKSEVGNYICESRPELDFVVLFGSSGVSFRSKKYNVCKIAKLNGGGGNIYASGCPLSGILNKGIDELIIEKLKVV